MGNLFSTGITYREGPMTMARWQRQLDAYTHSLAEQKQLLAKINRGELPTPGDMRAIDFDSEHYCQYDCNERKIPKRTLMALYKRKTIEYIKITEQSIAEHMAKKPTETSRHRKPARRQPVRRQPTRRQPVRK